MNNEEKIITLRSLTHAIKAKKLLREHGIDARVVRPNTSKTDKGCGYGVALEQYTVSKAESLLRENGISPLEIGR